MEYDPSVKPDGDKNPSEITLRPFDLSDVDDFMVWATDERVTKFCTWEPYTSREAALEYLKNTVIPHPWFRAIFLDGRPIGAVSVSSCPRPNEERRAELGYVLGSKYWGRGIMTRAVTLVGETIFRDWGHLERLEALVDLENAGSQRVLEKAGFTREGVLRKYMTLKGRTRDMVMFSLLSTDSF